MTESFPVSAKVIYGSIVKEVQLNQPSLYELHSKVIECYPELAHSPFFLGEYASFIFTDIDLLNAVENIKENVLELTVIVASDPLEISMIRIVKEELEQINPKLNEIVSLEAKSNLALQNLPQKNKTVHKGIICNECKVNPITGARYKCTICANYNLCESCEDKDIHSHVLLKMYSEEKNKSKISFEVTEEDRQEERKMLSQFKYTATRRKVDFKGPAQYSKPQAYYGEQYVNAFPRVRENIRYFCRKTNEHPQSYYRRKWVNECE